MIRISPDNGLRLDSSKRDANLYIVVFTSGATTYSGFCRALSNKPNLLIQILGLKEKWVFLELDTPSMGM